MIWTNKGLYMLLGWGFRNVSRPTNLYVALCTDAVVPTVDINTLGQLTQVGTGTGYTDGGFQLTPGTTDFDVLTEDDTNDYSFVQVKDISWTASGGAISGAQYAVLTDDNGTIANRQVIAVWDLVAERNVSDTFTLNLAGLELRLVPS